MNLAVRVFRNDAADKSQIGRVHAYNPIEPSVIGTGDLTRTFCRVEPYTVLVKATLCRRINRIADLLCRNGCRLYKILILNALSLYQSLKDEFSHRAAAYISVADKKDSHILIFPLVNIIIIARPAIKKAPELPEPSSRNVRRKTRRP